MSSKKRLRLEQLEPRCTPTVVCDANPAYAAECNYFDNLITPSMITDTAVQSGNWSDPATWSNGVPGNGANAWIPNGIAVTVDGQEPGSLHSILDNGLLTFATNVNTSLLVDTIAVGTDNNPTNTPEGELDIGTTANPIQPGVTATITFADDGTLTQAWPNDPNQLARGLLSMNTVSIVGATVTPYEQMTGATAGSTTITLAAAPTGWNVGDTLLLPGTSPTADQDEQIAIAAISGNTVTLASPLVYSHAAPTGDPVYVADEHRNVIFQSQNTTDYERFGSIMFMHTDQETVQNADFLNLGRTNKSLPLGAKNPDGTTNVVGRYALHFHRDYWPTMSENDPPVLVSGNFEMGSPGWGYDNHSSNVDMEDNVAFDNNGAGFVTEAGNEIGTFNANMAVRTTTTVADPTNYGTNVSRFTINDFGFTGSGFWMQSPSVALTNNIALDDVTGFTEMPFPLTYPAPLGQVTAWSGLSPLNAPLNAFSSNTAAESTDGVELFFVQMGFIAGSSGSVIDDLAAWDVTNGVDVSVWASHVTIQNSALLGTGFQGAGIAEQQGGYGSDISAINDNVTGFAMGMPSSSLGVCNTEGGYWDDTTAFEITQDAGALGRTRQLSYSGISFGPDVKTQYQWDAQDTEQTSNPNSDFVLQTVSINGVQAYFPNQAPDYVPFPVQDPYTPAALVGLTNAQLMQTYGLAMEDEVASSSTQATPFYYGLLSNAVATSSQYTLAYNTPNGLVVEATPTTLQPGWNLLTRIVDGAPHSWLVGYMDGSGAAPAPGNASSYQIIGNLVRKMPITVTNNGSSVEATGQADPTAIVSAVQINNGGNDWLVYIFPNQHIAYVYENGAFVEGVTLDTTTNVYSFDITSNGTGLSLVVNGKTYI